MRHAIKRVVGYRTHNRSTPDRVTGLRPNACPTDAVGSRRASSSPNQPTLLAGGDDPSEASQLPNAESRHRPDLSQRGSDDLASARPNGPTPDSADPKRFRQGPPSEPREEDFRDTSIAAQSELGTGQRSAASDDRRPALHSLAQYLPQARFFAGEDIEFTDVADSPEKAETGELVVYRLGVDDPVEVIADALARGAAGILTEQVLPAPLPQCIVPDTDRALAEIATKKKGHPHQKLILIGVAGSAGKTTTATCIAQVLTDIPCRTAVITDHACSDGVVTEVESEPVASGGRLIEKLHEAADAGAAVAVVELGDRQLQFGGYDKLELDILVVAGQKQHRQDFGPSPVQCAIERVTAQGLVVVHSADQTTIETARSAKTSVLTYGTDERAEVRLVAHELAGGVLTALLRFQDRASLLESSLAAGHGSEALAAAAAVGIVTENSLPQIAESLSKVRTLPGRLHSIQPAFEPTTDTSPHVVLDLAGTPHRAKWTLNHVRQQMRSRRQEMPASIPMRSPKSQAVSRKFPNVRPPRLWCVLAVTASDGPETLMQYGRLLETMADQCVLTCAGDDKPDFLRLCHGVLDGVADCASMRLVADHRRAVRWAIEAAASQDTVLILGGLQTGASTQLVSNVETVQAWVQESPIETKTIDPDTSKLSASSIADKPHLKLFQPETDEIDS